MKYTLEQKAQIMALKNPKYTYACELDQYVFITDGHFGYYIKKANMIVDYKKLKPITTGDRYEPETIIKNTVSANKTRNMILLPSGKIAIKLKSEDGKKAWVNTEYLKPFGDSAKLRISSEWEAVYISDYKDVPLGMVMPIKVREDMEAEE